MAVVFTAFPMTSIPLTATALFAGEGIIMVKEIGVLVFKSLTTVISAILCSYVAAEANPHPT